jgi:acetoin utilization protein AcuC
MDIGMTHKTGFVYANAFEGYNFGATHPLRPIRLKLTFELMKSIGLLSSPAIQVHEPRQATRDELLLFHDETYLELVERMSKVGSGFLDMGDTPVFKGCYEASALAVGASLTAVDLVMSRDTIHAMNIAGGLHHAHPSRASGFCIFNDPAVSIAYLKKKYSLDRILYLDVDAHHGDGVMYGFYSDEGVLDVDFHEDGHHLFPGTGFTEEVGAGRAAGVKINVPLSPFTGDETYLRLFREIVPAAVRKYRPQIMLVQCGADSHANDLLAHLQLTTRSYCEIAATCHDLAHEVSDGRLVIFGGGGYNPSNVARAWSLVASTLVDFGPPEDTPDEWRRLFEAVIGEEAPRKISSLGEGKNAVDDMSMDYGKDVLKDLKSRISLLA